MSFSLGPATPCNPAVRSKRESPVFMGAPSGSPVKPHKISWALQGCVKLFVGNQQQPRAHDERWVCLTMGIPMQPRVQWRKMLIKSDKPSNFILKKMGVQCPLLSKSRWVPLPPLCHTLSGACMSKRLMEPPIAWQSSVEKCRKEHFSKSNMRKSMKMRCNLRCPRIPLAPESCFPCSRSLLCVLYVTHLRGGLLPSFIPTSH
jgi:hypothetical protein